MNTELLGEVVTWDLRSAETSFVAVQDALRDSGLDPDSAKELTPRIAFGRACQEFKKDRAIDKLTLTTKGLASFQFTKKHLATTGMGQIVEYDYECRVELDCNSGDIRCPENTDLERHAQELFAHAMQMRNAQDVTRLVQRLFQDHADLFPINPRKGVAYFVPEKHREFTAKVDVFLKTLGGELARFPVPKGTPQGNASVKEAVQAGLTTLVSELNEAVAGWDETTRQSTMDKAFEKWQLIEYKVDAYADYLESEQVVLKERLVAAKAELVKKISQVQAEPEVAVA